jgi:1-aminocyclopropane-1-carboxylate deaminase/D-cysteine desulfhydrase-like pyridoxal-dependent ACC family enzyme
MAFPTTTYTNEVTAEAALRNELTNLGLSTEGISSNAAVVSLLANWLKDMRSINPIGYQSGKAAGGTVTQATSKSTGVTLSKITGKITMNNAALAAAAEVTFTVTNTLVAADDVVVVCHGSAGTSGGYTVGASNITAGAFDITVGNHTAGSLSEAIVLNFVVIKGADD